MPLYCRKREKEKNHEKYLKRKGNKSKKQTNPDVTNEDGYDYSVFEQDGYDVDDGETLEEIRERFAAFEAQQQASQNLQQSGGLDHQDAPSQEQKPKASTTIESWKKFKDFYRDHYLASMVYGKEKPTETTLRILPEIVQHKASCNGKIMKKNIPVFYQHGMRIRGLIN